MKQDKLIWFAIVFSTFMYAIVIYILHPRPEGSFEDNLRLQMTMILYGVAVVAFMLGFFVPSIMRGPARLKMVVALAIFESCAIYGLVAAMLARDWRLYIPAWILALAGMVRAFPSSEEEQVAR